MSGQAKGPTDRRLDSRRGVRPPFCCATTSGTENVTTMTTTTRRIGVALVSSVATLAVAAGTLAAPADAVGPRDLKPLISRYDATIVACKLSVDGGTKVRVYAQLDNTRNSGRRGARSGGVYVLRNGDDTGKGFRFPVTPGGARSRMKSVTFSVGGTIEISAGIGAGQMGDGATFRLRRVQPC